MPHDAAPRHFTEDDPPRRPEALSTTTSVNFGSATVIPTGVTATQVTFVVP
ncbi:hypothetical protein SAMN05428954_7148 [Streptomyces sp. 2112.3]|nr:hypothetical protein SAMN05428954_7148 [Streptomyces sp. 2112.3]